MERLRPIEILPVETEILNRVPDLRNEEYLGARGFAAFPLAFGREKGGFVVAAVNYFRWVDDLVDASDLSLEKKFEFIERQIQLHQGTQENYPAEKKYLFFYNQPRPHRKEIKNKALLVLGSIKEDLAYQGFWARTHREIRHYNTRLILNISEAVALIINQKPMKPAKEIADLLDCWTTLASLADLKEDINRRMLQVPFSREEAKAINCRGEEAERKKLALKIYNRQRFEEEKERCLTGLNENANAFWQADMPAWQKIVSTAYMKCREPGKLEREVVFPS